MILKVGVTFLAAAVLAVASDKNSGVITISGSSATSTDARGYLGDNRLKVTTELTDVGGAGNTYPDLPTLYGGVAGGAYGVFLSCSGDATINDSTGNVLAIVHAGELYLKEDHTAKELLVSIITTLTNDTRKYVQVLGK